ncbi:hypothetical protein Cgig2_009172 [Carnegiea gigantea]|uniref:Uncharacterized protein n=1 Tax=Carnegiea gigantea TaxID=171969 RepID=A0A9Q1KE91_9CARY|nr:hypothetical protein Cgig2_009172 [Carnegiea gigantea]
MNRLSQGGGGVKHTLIRCHMRGSIRIRIPGGIIGLTYMYGSKGLLGTRLSQGKGLRELSSYYILHRWTKMASSRLIFYVNGILWTSVLKWCMKTRRDLKKLTLVRERNQSVLKELKELDASTSESKIDQMLPSELIFSHKNVVISKEAVSVLKKKKTVLQQQKRQRLSKACGQQDYHASRNCPSKLST